MWIGARAFVYLRAYGVGLVAWVGGATTWAGGCNGVGLVALVDLFPFFFSLESSLCESYSLEELMGLMWWQMWQIRAVLRWCIDEWWLCCS